MVDDSASVIKGMTQSDTDLETGFKSGSLVSVMHLLRDDADTKTEAPILQIPPRRILNEAPRCSVAVDISSFNSSGEMMDAILDGYIEPVMVHVSMREKLLFVIFSDDMDAEAFAGNASEVFDPPVNVFIPIIRKPNMEVVNIEYMDSLGDIATTARALAKALSLFSTIRDLSICMYEGILLGEAQVILERPEYASPIPETIWIGRVQVKLFSQTA